MLRINNARVEQLDEILKIYDVAKEFMKKSGNPNQWDSTYPSR